jgi:hypothetical protein
VPASKTAKGIDMKHVRSRRVLQGSQKLIVEMGGYAVPQTFSRRSLALRQSACNPGPSP